MSKMIPFPGRSESHESWMRRCDEWKANRRIYRRGLSGKPDRHGYKAITSDEMFSLPDGRKVAVVRYGYGSQYSQLTEKFAETNGYGFFAIKIGCGMTARHDGVAYVDDSKNKYRSEVYDNDNH